MKNLLNETCVPCTGSLPPATEEEINTLKVQIPDWEVITKNGELRLQRVYKFPDFKTALAFTQLIGETAEQQGHHPTLLTEWGRVTVNWWTHAINGLHQNDFVMAAKSDRLANSL
jgi:4a-hydroxytetrahydrobiopterin dehydratase